MVTAKFTASILLCLALCQPAQAMADEPAPPPEAAVGEMASTLPGSAIIWHSPEPGLDLAMLAFVRQEEGTVSGHLRIRALRFDPERFDFRVFSARWEDGRIPTLKEWAARKGLAAATNACMYLKDGLTSTGYMRSGEKTNNGRIVKRYGSFFVSCPRRPGLPPVSILDRSRDDWEALLPQYDVVVQNFRLMGPEGQQLWPENGPRHAVAAVAEDLNGRILFLHCSDPLSVHEFVDALNSHKDLNLHSAMYVEGGSEASILLDGPEGLLLVNGMTPAGFMLSSRGNDIPIPNILAVVRR